MQNDTSELTRQFFELWQKQISAVMSHEQFIASMVDMMQAMQPSHSQENRRANAGKTDPADPGLKLSLDAIHERLDGIDYRLRMLESRLGEWESARGDRTGATKKPAAKRKPAGKGKAGNAS